MNGQTRNIPYAIYGCLGHGGQAISTTFPVAKDDHVYEFGYKGYGYALVKVTKDKLALTAFSVDWNDKTEPVKKQIDSIAVNLI